MLEQRALRDALDYDPMTGVFRWRYTARRARKGDRAGWIFVHPADGRQYRRITVGGRKYRANRLAWLWMTGQEPSCPVDHRDGDGLNDAWSNLRLATSSQNAANRKRSSINTSGYKGVSACSRTARYRARIRVNGRLISLGSYSDPQQAHRAYVAAAEQYFGEFARAA